MHDSHDLLLVSAFAAGDLAGDDLGRVHERLATCPDCAGLAGDLLLIASAIATLAVPRRPRDFVLGVRDAERLRPSRLRRALAALASPRSITRPLAAALTTLGLAGLLLTGLPQLPLVATPQAGAGADGGAYLAPSDHDLGTVSGGGEPAGDRDRDRDVEAGGDGPEPLRLEADEDGIGALVVVSGSLLIMGLGLYGVRWTGRRFGG